MGERMATVHLICGKICSGKTFFCRQLVKETGAIVLSCDERMLAMRPDGLFGDQHETIAALAQQELLQESLQLTEKGDSVILEWGFWTRADRQKISNFYREHGRRFIWHYMDVDDAQWLQNIAHRNEAVRAGKEKAYFVDEALKAKLERLFEPPMPEEIDAWHEMRRQEK